MHIIPLKCVKEVEVDTAKLHAAKWELYSNLGKKEKLVFT